MILVAVLVAFMVFLVAQHWARRTETAAARKSGLAGGDFLIDPPTARHRDGQSRTKLASLVPVDRAFVPEPLERLVRETFDLLQRAAVTGDLGPLAYRLADRLVRRPPAPVRDALEGQWFFQVLRRTGMAAEIAVLFQRAGGTSPRPTQEFWQFQLEPDGWRLASVDEVTPDSRCWGPSVVQTGPGPRVSEPERLMATLARHHPVWAPDALTDRVEALTLSIQAAQQARNLQGLDAQDFSPEVWKEITDQNARDEAEDLRRDVRSFGVRRVTVVLAREKTKVRSAQVLCRVATHGQTTVRRGEDFLSTDPELKITEQTWTLALTDDRWLVTERRAYP